MEDFGNEMTTVEDYKDVKPLYVDIAYESDPLDGQAVFPCFFCEKPFFTKRKLKKHTDNHRKDGRFHCSFCSKTFLVYRDIKKHSIIHNPDRQSFQCALCFKFITTKLSLTNHMKIHNKEYTAECEFCSRKFYRLSEKNLHVSEKHKGLLCPECGQRFNSHKKFRLHKKMHLDPDFKKNNSVECKYCKRAFAMGTFMKGHMAKCKENDERPEEEHIEIICDTCGKVFYSKHTFRYHMLMHTGIKHLECDICHKRFYYDYHLKIHKMTHTKERPFKCRFCDKTFGQSATARRHERNRHNKGDKKYSKCTYCQKMFTLDYVNRHMRNCDQNNDKQKFVCSTCGKTFHCVENLRIHMQIHNGEKLLECDVCQKRFLRPFTLRMHKLTHTGEKPFKCKYCDKCYTQPSAVKRHETREHSNTDNNYKIAD